jgi:hypothetical protein
MKKKYAPFIFFGCIIIFFAVREIIIKEKLRKNIRYTVGVVKKISVPVEGGPMADYEYEVNKKKYIGTFTINEKPEINIKDKFFVKFNVYSPNVSFPLVENKITIDLMAPDSGWKHIP